MSLLQADAARMLISGALIMGYATAAMFFYTFWRRTADRLFAFFSCSFVLLAVQRLFLSLTGDTSANASWLYALRLVAFLLILAAILDKNRQGAR
jgi:hypothetical protein